MTPKRVSPSLRTAVQVAIAVTFTGLTAATVTPPASACQQPPGAEVPCRLVPDSPVVTTGDPFTVDVTITNFPVTAPFPPPFLDDLFYDVNIWDSGLFGPDACYLVPGLAGEVTLVPSFYAVELDEAWSPFADEPTSDTRSIAVTQAVPGDYYSLTMNATSYVPAGRGRWCQAELCVQAFVDPSTESGPYAEFVQSQNPGDAGATVPLGIRVLRNNFPKTQPLTVRVVPENLSDPIDLFPIDPPELATTGVVVIGDDEIITFSCGMHFPCFVGVDNIYHVTIHDGPALVWDSRSVSSTGIGRSLVVRSPLARQELVEIRDDGADGSLEVGEHGEIQVRLYARNPYFFSSMVDAVLETAVPAGLTVKSWTLHKHDNPMDAYDPTPAELAATGVVTQPAGKFRVEVTEIPARFVDGNFDPPPTVFADMFEVELHLETPPGGFAVPVDLVFPGVDVTGIAAGNAKSETSAPLTVSVTAASIRPPNPTGQLLVVKSGTDDVRLVWADSAIDPSHAAAGSYTVYRSLDQVVAGYLDIATVADTPASSEESTDLGALGRTELRTWYRVSAFNAAGDSGDIPPG